MNGSRVARAVLRASVAYAGFFVIAWLSLTIGACGGSAKIDVSGANGALNINFNRNNTLNFNINGPPAVNRNFNGVFNTNGAPGDILPPEFQGHWSVDGNCATFMMTVMGNGTIAFDPSPGISSFSGSVAASGAFNITIVQADDTPVPPGQPQGTCTSLLTGQLTVTGQVFGNGTRQCTGDAVNMPCQFGMLRR